LVVEKRLDGRWRGGSRIRMGRVRMGWKREGWGWEELVEWDRYVGREGKGSGTLVRSGEGRQRQR
jgi:hypothetical protein